MATMKGNRDPLTEKVIGGAITVHRELGPGLLESTHEQCQARELLRNGLAFQMQVPLPVDCKGIKIDCSFRLAMMAEGRLLLELKSVEGLFRIHEARILTYLKLAKLPRGLLIDFNVRRLMGGLKSFLLSPSCSS